MDLSGINERKLVWCGLRAIYILKVKLIKVDKVVDLVTIHAVQTRLGMASVRMIARRLRARFFKKIQDWIFKSEKNTKMDFAFLYILNRSIQDVSDYGASKEPKNSLPEWITRLL